LERCGGIEDVYFYALTYINSENFNFLGKALPAGIHTGA
jgi:hypothetical protein